MLQVIEEASQLQDLEASKSSSMFAEAMIVPLNPHKISSYITGAALESERIDGKLNWNQAADNIETAREYLATCSNGFEYNSACAEFLEETFLVQAGSDPEDIFCPAIQGARINDVAREWRKKLLTEMIRMILNVEWKLKNAKNTRKKWAEIQPRFAELVNSNKIYHQPNVVILLLVRGKMVIHQFGDASFFVVERF